MFHQLMGESGVARRKTVVAMRKVKCPHLTRRYVAKSVICADESSTAVLMENGRWLDAVCLGYGFRDDLLFLSIDDRHDVGGAVLQSASARLRHLVSRL